MPLCIGTTNLYSTVVLKQWSYVCMQNDPKRNVTPTDDVHAPLKGGIHPFSVTHNIAYTRKIKTDR